jgi:hypothetical protein
MTSTNPARQEPLWAFYLRLRVQGGYSEALLFTGIRRTGVQPTL